LRKLKDFKCALWSEKYGSYCDGFKSNVSGISFLVEIEYLFYCLGLCGIPWQAPTNQPIELENCSNPLKMGKVLQFSMKKIFWIWMSFLFIDVCMMGVCLCIFCLHWDDVIGPWMPRTRAIFMTRVFIGK